MFYSTSLSRMVDNIFAFPYMSLDASSGYDYVTSDKDGTKITVVVPGFSKEDLSLNVNDNYLTLTSKVEDKKLTRTWRLADLADTKSIKAECKNGILTINIPLKTKSDKSRNVEIA